MNNVNGGEEVYAINEAMNLKLPGAHKRTAQDHARLAELQEKHSDCKQVGDDHSMCRHKLRSLSDKFVKEEFDDPELLWDAAASDDSDLLLK